MGTAYNGDGTVPRATNPWTAIAIASTSNVGGSYGITTTPPHGFADGDTVSIEGCLAAGADGTWQIVVTGGHTFILTGSTYSATVGAGGIALDYSVNPLISLPDDGDPLDVSTVNPAFEESANIVPYLYKRVGQFNLLNIERTHFDDSLSGTLGSATSVAAVDGWKLITGTGFAYTPFKINLTDYLEIEWSFVSDTPTAGARAGYAIGISYDAGVTWAQMPRTAIANVSEDMIGRTYLRGILWGDDIGSGNGRSLSIGILGSVPVTTCTFQVNKPYHLQLKHFRFNG